MVLAFGVVALAAVHLVPAVPRFKHRLKASIGESAYGPVFGLASLAALAIMVLGWWMADFVAVYDPPDWGRYANFILTAVAFVCFGVFLFRGSLRQRLRFPMGLAAIFWGLGHLLANGDVASLILFGGLLAYAAAHIVIGMMHGARPSPDVRAGHDLLSVVSGIALYAMMAQAHGILIGVPVFALS